MPVLTLSFKDKKIQDYPVAVGQDLSIGRKPSNDIVIDNLAVSGVHARIESVAGTYVIRDMDSTNGTYVNREKVEQYNLRHNDVILIGKHELIFDRSDLMKKAGSLDDPYLDEKTRVLDTGDFKNILSQKQDSSPAPGSTDEQPQNRSFFGRILKMIFG